MTGIQLIAGRDAVALADQVWPCYDTVFGDFDAYGVWRSELFERHARREGFRLAIAVDDATVMGFSWVGTSSSSSLRFSHRFGRPASVKRSMIAFSKASKDGVC